MSKPAAAKRRPAKKKRPLPKKKGGDETNGGGGDSLHLQAFQSPSGNIGCIMFEGGARCDIDKHSWTPPPRPASCSDQVDYGQGLAVSR